MKRKNRKVGVGKSPSSTSIPRSTLPAGVVTSVVDEILADRPPALSEPITTNTIPGTLASTRGGPSVRDTLKRHVEEHGTVSFGRILLGGLAVAATYFLVRHVWSWIVRILP